MYTIQNVLELLDIIYYRHLDFSVSDICELSKSLDPKRVYTLVEQQRKNVERRIRYVTAAFKKKSHIFNLYLKTLKQKKAYAVYRFSLPPSFFLKIQTKTVFSSRNTAYFY